MFDKQPDPFRRLAGSENQNNVFDWDTTQGRQAEEYSAISGFEFGAAKNVDNDLSTIFHPGRTDSPSPNDGSVTEMLSHQGVEAGPIGDATHNLTSLGAKDPFVKAAAEMVRQAVMQGDTFEAAMNTTKRSFRQKDSWVFDHPEFKRSVEAVKKTAGILGPVFVSPTLYTSCQTMKREASKAKVKPRMVLAASMCRTCPMNRGGHCTVMNCPVGGRRMLAANLKQHRRKQAQLRKAAQCQRDASDPSPWQQPDDDVFGSSEKDSGCGHSSKDELKKEAAAFLRYVTTSNTVDYQRSRTITASAKRPHEQVVRAVLSMKGLRLPRHLTTKTPRSILAALGLNPRDHGDLIPKLARMVESNQDKSAEMYKEVAPISVTNDPLAEMVTSMDMEADPFEAPPPEEFPVEAPPNVTADPLPLTAEDVMGAVVGYVAQELGQQPQNQLLDMEIDTTPMSCGDEELIPRIAAPGRSKKKKKKVQLNPDGSERGRIATLAHVDSKAHVSGDSNVFNEAQVRANKSGAPKLYGSTVEDLAIIKGNVLVINAIISKDAVIIAEKGPIKIIGPNVKITGGVVIAKNNNPIEISGQAKIKAGDFFSSEYSKGPLILSGGYGRGGEDVYLDEYYDEGYGYDELEEYPDPPKRPDLVLSADQLNRAFRGEPAILPDGVETIPIERTRQFLRQMAGGQSIRDLVDLAPSEDEWNSKMTFNSKFDLWNVIRYVSWSLKKAGKPDNYGTDHISSSFLDEATKKQAPSKKVPCEHPTLLVKLIQKYARIDDPRKVSFKIKTGNHRHTFSAKRSGSRIASGNNEQKAQYILKLMEAEDIARELTELSQEEF